MMSRRLKCMKLLLLLYLKVNRREIVMKKKCIIVVLSVLGILSTSCCAGKCNPSGSVRNQWYRDSIYNWFITHHVVGTEEVGRDIDVKKITQFIKQQNPGYIGVHARGPMGWALYPAEIGYVLPKLHVDLVEVFSGIADELNKPLLIYYNLGRDKEIEKRKPEWNRIDINGELYPMSISYLTEVKEKYLWPQIREIMLKYNPDAFWFDGSVYSVWPCFREETKARFKELTGKEAPKSVDSPLWDQYREMQRQVWREFTAETTDFVHNIDPDCLVSYNMSYTVWMPEKPDEDVDFTTMDLGHLTEDISLVTRFTDTQGIPFEILLPVRFFLTERTPLIKPMEQMKQDAAQVIANGGIFSAWDQPSETTVFLPGHQERLIELSKWVHQRKPWCHKSVSLPDASVLIIAKSHYLPDEQFEKFPSCKSTKQFCYPHENIRVRGACYGLNRHHVHNSIIADWRLKEGPVTAKLLVVEDAKVIPDDVFRAIADFADKGGTVLLTGMCVKEPQVAGLAGIELSDFNLNAEVYSTKAAKNKTIDFKHQFYRVNTPRAEILRRAAHEGNKSEYPLLTQRNYGKGQIFYCSTPVFTDYSFSEMPDQIVDEILSIVLPADKRNLLVQGPASIEVSLHVKDNLQVIHLVNKSIGEIDGMQHTKRVKNVPPAPPSHLSLKLSSKPASVLLQPGSRKVQWDYKNGRVEIDVPTFKIYEIVAVTLSTN